MADAIRIVLPQSNHRICSWHAEQGIKEHLIYCSSFVNDFRSLMCDACSPAVFDERWHGFLAKHRTAKNQGWLDRLYEKRELWAAASVHDKFFLGMANDQRTECLARACTRASRNRPVRPVPARRHLRRARVPRRGRTRPHGRHVAASADHHAPVPRGIGRAVLHAGQLLHPARGDQDDGRLRDRRHGDRQFQLQHSSGAGMCSSMSIGLTISRRKRASSAAAGRWSARASHAGTSSV